MKKRIVWLDIVKLVSAQFRLSDCTFLNLYKSYDKLLRLTGR